MRHTARALVGIVLVASCSQNLAAAEATWRWWPFGHREEAKVAQPPSVAAPSTTPPVRPQVNSTAGATAPSGLQSAPPVAPPAQLPSTSADVATDDHWMLKSPTGKVSWPHLTKPKLPQTGIWSQKPAADATRNSWADKTPVTPKPSPLKPITDGAQKVSKSTKAAWHKTVDALTPGEATPSRSSGDRIAKREVKPSLYQRMFGPEPESKGSQTVPEFMAQQRLDP